MLILMLLLLVATPVSADIINGVARDASGNTVILETCSGTVQVDASTAIANQRSVPLSAGSSLVVEGTMSGGIFQAVTIANHMFACPPPPPANVPGAQMMPRGMQQ